MPKRTHIVPVRLTDTEYRRLETLSRKSGLSASEVVRSSLAGIQLRERPPNDLGALYTEINRIGNNINQIAR
ncbi:MAG: MobC family plasmid mobilization relaxosome protein, partial [Clostridiales bacterium]|nr:MobC family plasmid mobilization relaxosome protein [Clostridiales bacterium]